MRTARKRGNDKMFYAVLLPLFAACYIFAAAFLKKRAFAWEIGTVSVGVSFLKIVSMAFKNHFQGKTYSVSILPFLTLDGKVYDWRLHLETAEIFLVVFIVFSALICLIYSKSFLPAEKMNRFVVFLLGLTSCLIIGVGAKNMFQFFAGWDLSALFSYMLLMLFHEQQAVRRSGVNFLIWHTLCDVPLLCACFMLASRTGDLSVAAFAPESLTVFENSGAVVFAVLLLLGVSAKLFLFGTNILIAQTAGISVPALAFIAPAALGGVGVYVLYVFFPFVEKDQTVRTVFTVWGALTAAGGVLTAAAQTNVKIALCQLLMAQFGFVLTAFGLIGRDAAFCAYIALITPMTGLILCAGIVTRALRGEEDVSRMGGLKRRLPAPFWTMILLGLCCVGFPQIGNSAVVWDMHAVLRRQGSTAGNALLTAGLFAAAFAVARLICRIFTGEAKSPPASPELCRPSETQMFPLAVLLLLSFFQNKVFEQSVLPDLSETPSLTDLVCMLAGAGGLPAGLWWFSKHAGKNAGAVTLFFRRGFGLTGFYETVFVRPFMALSEFAWRFASAELLTEKLPKMFQKAAERSQKFHSEQPSVFLIWFAAGLFLLIFSLLRVVAGG